jgi:hypothetical protein
MKISRIAGIAATACLALATPSLQAQNAPAPAADSTKATKPLIIVSRPIDARALKLSSTGNWHRIEVELKVLSEGIKEALSAQGITDSKVNNASVKWVNNVKVTLIAGYKPSGTDLGKPKVMQDVVKLKEAVTGGKSYAEAKDPSKAENWRYYKASATVLTLEANVARSVFFYIPADVVKRDDINNPKPDVAYVTLEVDGKDVPTFDAAGNPFTGSFGSLYQSGKASKVIMDKFKEVADRATRDTDGVMRPQNLITSFHDGDWFKSSPEFVREDAAK